MKKIKNGKSYIYTLLVLNVLVWTLVPFVASFDLVNNEAYHFIIFGFTLLTSLALLLISVAELISLRIDRTATKNTFFAALFIFVNLLASKDIVYFLSVFTPNINSDFEVMVKYVSPIVFVLSYTFALYFLFKFFEHDFGVKKISTKILIGSLLLNATCVVFICVGIYPGIIAVTLTQGIITILLGLYYLLKSSKNNYLTAILTYFIILSFSFSFILSLFPISGPQILFYLLVAFAFVAIYLNFFISKTNLVYQYDDEIKEKQVNKVMTVKCFQCFDCFIDDEVVVFPTKKCKEFFALLIILNGKTLTMDKAITYLYPDKDIEKAKISYRDIIWKLRKLFESLSFNGVSFRRGETTLQLNHIKCDYIDVINHKTKYDGSPLMPEYDWSFEFENILEK